MLLTNPDRRPPHRTSLRATAAVTAFAALTLATATGCDPAQDEARAQCQRLTSDVVAQREAARKLVGELDALRTREAKFRAAQVPLPGVDEKRTETILRKALPARTEAAELMVGPVEVRFNELKTVRFELKVYADDRTGETLLGNIARADAEFYIENYRRVPDDNRVAHVISGHDVVFKLDRAPPGLPETGNLPLNQPLPNCQVADAMQAAGTLTGYLSALKAFLPVGQMAVRESVAFLDDYDRAVGEARRKLATRKRKVQALLAEVGPAGGVLIGFRNREAGLSIHVAGPEKADARWRQALSEEFDIRPDEPLPQTEGRFYIVIPKAKAP